MINIHYAFQSCDIKSFQGQKRFCGDDRTLLSKKSIKSFLSSVKYCAHNNPHTTHHIAIFDDHSTQELKSYHKKCQKEFQTDNIIIELIDLIDEQGISTSIRRCYEWLYNHGKDLVYQVQDDYMFVPTAIEEMVDVFYQMYNETNTQCVVGSVNNSWIWKNLYKNKVTPRTIIAGKHRYWIQYYDMSCSFLTSHEQFEKHWELYNMFLYLTDKIDDEHRDLENKSINYILVQRGVLGLHPIDTVGFHMQSENEKDPYIDWKPIWDSINVA